MHVSGWTMKLAGFGSPRRQFMSTTLRFVRHTRHRVRQNTWSYSTTTRGMSYGNWLRRSLRARIPNMVSYSPFTIGSHRTFTITGMATCQESTEERMHMEPSRTRHQCAMGMPFSQRHC